MHQTRAQNRVYPAGAFYSNFFAFFIIFLTLFNAPGCIKQGMESYDAYIQKLIAAGKIKDAMTEIRGLLEKENLLNSTLLSGYDNSNRLIKRSLSGNSIAWVDGPLLFFWYKDKFNKMELPFQPIQLNISHSGDNIVAIQQAENNVCRAYPVSMEEKHLFSGSYEVDCNHTPAISKDGAYLYYVHGGNLHVSDLKKETKTKTISLSQIKPKYQKLANSYYLYDLPHNALFILYGTAGYYQSYYYQGKGDKLIKKLEGFSRPLLYGSNEDFVPTITGEEENEKKPVKKITPKNNAAYLYYGGAGNLELYGITLDAPPQLKKEFSKFRYTASLSYLRNSGNFLVVRNQLLHYFDPDRVKYKTLPMHLKRFELFSEGIIFEDSQKRLHFRRNPFTPKEYEILELYYKARDAKNKGKKG